VNDPSGHPAHITSIDEIAWGRILVVVSLVMQCLDQRGETPAQAGRLRRPIRETAWAKRQDEGFVKIMKE